MKKLKRLLLSLAVISMAFTAMGQGLPGANVIEAGTTNGTITAADGTFSFNTSSQSGTIVISFIGYTSQTISFDLGSSSDVGRISLELDAKNIDEVVEATRRAGLSRPVARFVPIGNVKG